MPDNRHVGIAVTGTRPLVIFPKNVVEYPVQVILNAPVRPHDLPQPFRVGSVHAADEVTGFFRGLVLAFADGSDRDDAGQLWPMGMVFLHPADVGSDPDRAKILCGQGISRKL